MQDLDGKAWDMKFSQKQSAAGHVARYIAGIGPWMRTWGVRAGDRVSLGAGSGPQGSLCSLQLGSWAHCIIRLHSVTDRIPYPFAQVCQICGLLYM